MQGTSPLCCTPWKFDGLGHWVTLYLLCPPAMFSLTEQIHHNPSPGPGSLFNGSCLQHYVSCSKESNVELWSTCLISCNLFMYTLLYCLCMFTIHASIVYVFAFMPLPSPSYYCKAPWVLRLFNFTYCILVPFSCDFIFASHQRCWFPPQLTLIACSNYNACKFWTRRTSGSVHWWTVAWRYAYKNLMLHSRSQVLCIQLSWTLEVENAIEVHVLTTELWTHIT